MKTLTEIFAELKKWDGGCQMICHSCHTPAALNTNGYSVVSNSPLTVNGWCWGCYKRFGNSSDAAKYNDFVIVDSKNHRVNYSEEALVV